MVTPANPFGVARLSGDKFRTTQAFPRRSGSRWAPKRSNLTSDVAGRHRFMNGDVRHADDARSRAAAQPIERRQSICFETPCGSWLNGIRCRTVYEPTEPPKRQCKNGSH